jgi:hypothetical protein
MVIPPSNGNADVVAMNLYPKGLTNDEITE